MLKSLAKKFGRFVATCVQVPLCNVNFETITGLLAVIAPLAPSVSPPLAPVTAALIAMLLLAIKYSVDAPNQVTVALIAMLLSAIKYSVDAPNQVRGAATVRSPGSPP